LDVFSLTAADGSTVDVEVEWDDGGDEATLSIPGGLAGSTDYVLAVTCAETTTISFSTSEYGIPLSIGDDALIGRTFALDLAGAHVGEPAGFGAIIGAFVENPLVIGISEIDTTEGEIEFIAAEGTLGSDGVVRQDMDKHTVHFEDGDWSAAPYFAASTEWLLIVYEAIGSPTTKIPLHDVDFEGTFNADATLLGGGRLTGLVDTRHMGPLIGLGSHASAWCDSMMDFGLPCIGCGDGHATCIYMDAYFDDAPLVDGFTMVPVTTGSYD
jgi:hypothetical protein